MGVEEHRWNDLSAKLGVLPNHEEFLRLTSAYSEPHRAYHTLQHLSECMEKLDWAKSEAAVPKSNLAEVALWYHDAIYRPRASDNEQQSARWADEYLSNAGTRAEDCQSVRSMIMATCHGEKPTEITHKFVVDIDLSILGAESSRFEEYEQQVREEYRWVPWFVYRKKRRELLEHFLASPRLYCTDLFHGYFEQSARKNLQQSITKLKKR